jgi:hypothetical protein
VRLEVGSLRVSPEGELKNRHSWKAETLAQRFDVRRDDPEILGDERQVIEREG